MKKMLLPCLLSLCACSTQVDSSDETMKIYLHDYGIAMTPKQWQERGGDGVIIRRDRHGSESRTHYKNHLKEGIETETYPGSERIHHERHYTKGRLLKERHYTEDGVVAHGKDYLGGHQVRSYQWYKDGSPMVDALWHGAQLYTGTYYDAKGTIIARVVDGQGTEIVFRDDGTIAHQRNYQKGRARRLVSYDQRGLKRESLQLNEKGKPEGEKNVYGESGALITREHWCDGKRHGLMETWHQGHKIGTITYVNDLKHGHEYRYDTTGALVEHAMWFKGKRHGKLFIYQPPSKEPVEVRYFYRGRSLSRLAYERLTNQK